jgi:hypothetical protein
MLWEESIKYSIKEEVPLSKKNKSKVLPLTWLKPTYPSLNPSVSPLFSEVPPPDKPSLNASSLTGTKFKEIHSLLTLN